VLGGLAFEVALVIRERHLGLHTAAETRGRIDYHALGRAVARQVDLERLSSLARPGTVSRDSGNEPDRPVRRLRHERCRIAVARDAAFCFYYEDNLELLEAAGAELVEWSPLAAQALPPGTDGVYLGGGYPELHAPTLTGASGLRAELRRFADEGGMIYAECGG